MRNYLDMLQLILDKGKVSTDRTGTGTVRYFGPQFEFDLSEGFPLMTTKKLHLKSIIHELLWFLSGDTNIRYLQQNGVTIWDEWADKNGDLGPIYGSQWRKWRSHREQDGKFLTVETDQIADLMRTIAEKPDSRRMIVSAWNPAEVNEMALPPCHTLWQVMVYDGSLHMKLYQRSADMFLGVPFNIASYALLTHMIAHVTGLKPGRFVHTFGDAHIYLNHMDQVQTQLAREPREKPRLVINRQVENLLDFRFEDFSFEGYDPAPHISAPISV